MNACVCMCSSACMQEQSTIMFENPQLTCSCCIVLEYACMRACVCTHCSCLNWERMQVWESKVYNFSSCRRYQLPSLLSAAETIL